MEESRKKDSGKCTRQQKPLMAEDWTELTVPLYGMPRLVFPCGCVTAQRE